MGWYGFCIFGQRNQVAYDPHAGDAANGYCNGQRTQAAIGSFTTCNNKRGFEIVSGENIRLKIMFTWIMTLRDMRSSQPRVHTEGTGLEFSTH